MENQMPEQKSLLGARAAFYLIRDMNCGQASLRVFQDRFGLQNDSLISAATGLEGGLVANGCTCGVVTGGTLGLSQALDETVRKHGLAGEIAGLERVREYTDFFTAEYGSTACRDRVGVDFHTLSGQIRYFLNPHKIGKCANHIAGALRCLEALGQIPLSVPNGDESPKTGSSLHCATAVLNEVRKRTNVHDPYLSRLVYVFDGGVGLSGGACGAAIGAILAINLLLGMDLRNVPYVLTFKPFLVGHFNLFREKKGSMPEPFSAGKVITDALREKAGSLCCSEITRKDFSGWEDFAAFRKDGGCREVISLLADEAVHLIETVQYEAAKGA